ncbi:hypothetical protein SAMN05216567_11866 [Variovorax sp. OK605]|nr:hypothetical protein [Variovorax sp. OK605]SFQ52246.1 hypothetical protein SAMN05216567_11866 [Variovorax sp. OK605]
MDIVWLAAVAAVWVLSAEALVRFYGLDAPLKRDQAGGKAGHTAGVRRV